MTPDYYRCVEDYVSSLTSKERKKYGFLIDETRRDIQNIKEIRRRSAEAVEGISKNLRTLSERMSEDSKRLDKYVDTMRGVNENIVRINKSVATIRDNTYILQLHLTKDNGKPYN